MRGIHWLSLAVLMLGIVAGARYFLAREEAVALRSEREFLAQESKRVSGLRAEHERLVASSIPEPELQRLRSDRAALVRLRAELSQLEQNAERKGRLLETLKAGPLPALVLNVGISKDGALSLDGEPTEEEAMRQLFAQLARKSERVELRLRFDPSETPMASIKERVEGIARWQKESGLRMSLHINRNDAGVAK
jgi:hypothetical protein